ncbi:MAG: tetratricopeptide repeat protein [Candidatus Caenarcaniphilales bacterium]|nr:tetratricopeptide repeat protein [Candidatus Caenarcaniphilales bacterium]
MKSKQPHTSALFLILTSISISLISGQIEARFGFPVSKSKTDANKQSLAGQNKQINPPKATSSATPRKYSLNSTQQVSAESINQLLERGRVAFENNNYSGALSAYTAALQKDASNPRTHFGLGATYLAQRNYDLAIEHFETALELNPALIEAYYSLAYVYQATGRADLALKIYRKALGLDIYEGLPRNSFLNEITLGDEQITPNSDRSTSNINPSNSRLSSLKIEEDPEENDKPTPSYTQRQSAIKTNITYSKPQERKSRLKVVPQDPGTEATYSSYTSTQENNLQSNAPAPATEKIRKSPF